MSHQPLPWARDRYGNYRDADGERVVLVGFARAGSGTPETDPCYGNTALVGRAVNAHASLVAACEALLATGLNGGNNVRLALMAASRDVLSPEDLARGERADEAVAAAHTALALAREETAR